MTAGVFGQHWVEEGLDPGQPFGERHRGESQGILSCDVPPSPFPRLSLRYPEFAGMLKTSLGQLGENCFPEASPLEGNLALE
jgi:hypothetical protein